MNSHPYTSVSNTKCDWCGQPENHGNHFGGMGADVALMTGVLLGSLMKVGAMEEGNGLGMLDDVRPQMDDAGNYTNRLLVTTRAGTKFAITVTLEDE